MDARTPVSPNDQHPTETSAPRKRESTTSAESTLPMSDAPALPMSPGKAKRTLTGENVFRTVADVVGSGPVLLEAALRPKISAALREKLFLAVSSVNDCRYCKWGHTHWAMAKGVSLEEVNQILGHQAESLVARNPGEAAAILFAQHYAEQLDQFDPDSQENLRQFYSDAEVAEILAYVRFITLTNLTGNTVDAFLTGAHGQSNRSCFEAAIAAVASPVALLLTQLAKFDSKVGMEELRSKPRAATAPDSDTRQTTG